MMNRLEIIRLLFFRLQNTFSMSVSEGGGSPAPSENDEQKSSSTEYETVTEPSMNEENVEDDAPDDDGHLADREDSDYDEPRIELVSTCCFVYVCQGNWQSVTS